MHDKDTTVRCVSNTLLISLKKIQETFETAPAKMPHHVHAWEDYEIIY